MLSAFIQRVTSADDQALYDCRGVCGHGGGRGRWVWFTSTLWEYARCCRMTELSICRYMYKHTMSSHGHARSPTATKSFGDRCH